MLALIRVLLLVPLFVLISLSGIVFCLLRPFHRNNCHLFARILSRTAPLFGIKLILKSMPPQACQPCVYIANHQNNFDVVTISSAVTPGTVSIGKKSLKWIPLFGQLYWLTGNILIDRNNKSRAAGTISQTAERLAQEQLSVWMFPEGTRSRGRGLLPFKTGAFHTAMQAAVPIVPIVMSSTDSFRLNRWNNGHAIVEVMAPVDVSGYSRQGVRELASHCHELMADKLAELDRQVMALNQAAGVK